MIHNLPVLCTLTLFSALTSSAFAQSGENNKLFYDEPAQKWVEALPVGNGSMGAMVYGRVVDEQIQFNEETLWTGEPHDYSHPGAGDHLDTIRRLLEEGKQQEATDLAGEVFMSEPLAQLAYQPFGDLYLDFPDHENYTNYRRVLDLETAITSVEYEVDGVKYRREVLSSHPDQVIAIRITANKKEALNFSVGMDSCHFQKSIFTDGDRQTLNVRVVDGVLNGAASFRVYTNGEITNGRDKVIVSNANQAVIFLAPYTSFVNFKDVSGNTRSLINRDQSRFDQMDWREIKERHIADYQDLYRRFTIEFGGKSRTDTPTDDRIYAFWKDPDDPQFLALYVQYARYLMISSSRPGTQPANLQGIWNPHLDPPWQSKWTTNINAEMNYWPVEVTNLAETHEALFGLIEEASESGKIVADVHYNSRGWVLHHNTDIWRGAAPINASNHGIWQAGGGWLCHHLWEHYQFSQDEEFLAKYYPIIKNSALFFADTLFEDPHTGWLISSPSNSPEIGGLVAGPTMDHQIIRSLFNLCIKASRILDTDKKFAKTLEELVPRIAPNQIGQHGQLQEWLEDKDDPENNHRHVSHLWAVHPGKDINWVETPKMMKAARQSLIYRGDNGTGWSLAWKINFWARFLDGDHAYILIHNLLSPAEEPTKTTGGGSYPNLFDAHAPFQIDGNFGGAAGIVECVVQSHLDGIDVLPALPNALQSGQMTGARARGGFELDIRWSGGKLDRVEVLSTAGQTCTLRYGKMSVKFDTEKGKSYIFDGKLAAWGGTDKGKHLFILSGQSNMGGLIPEESFIPEVTAAFGTYRTITVKDAVGGQPISRWVKGWKSSKGESPELIADLYDRLLGKVHAAISGEDIQSVTFLWMQGERDSRNSDGDVYQSSMERLLKQLQQDLGRTDINFVVGRLSDCGISNKEDFPDWNMIREIHVAFAEASPTRAWVDTDDLNDGFNRGGKPIENDLHYSADGYVVFGERLAKEAIDLINK